jgi:small redox-active disulfide protein 2
MRKVQVLGPGCPRCEQVKANVEEAARAAGIEVEIEKISKPGEIAKRGVLLTPGLVIEGKVVCSGRVPSAEEIKGWIAGESAKGQQN